MTRLEAEREKKNAKMCVLSYGQHHHHLSLPNFVLFWGTVPSSSFNSSSLLSHSLMLQLYTTLTLLHLFSLQTLFSPFYFLPFPSLSLLLHLLLLLLLHLPLPTTTQVNEKKKNTVKTCTLLASISLPIHILFTSFLQHNKKP